MRNGNQVQTILKTNMDIVLILPMRNGNFSVCVILVSCTDVLILPMRNGNDLGEDINMEIFAKGSYPTYEEWKPSALLVS